MFKEDILLILLSLNNMCSPNPTGFRKDFLLSKVLLTVSKGGRI